jgi:hypothetical protein
MKKVFLYATSVVMLGTGLAVAQSSTCTSDPQTSSTTVSNTTGDTQTPSALDPQTSSPDSISRFNPVTGQNADSQRNPNAVSGNANSATGNQSSSAVKNNQDQNTIEPTATTPTDDSELDSAAQ